MSTADLIEADGKVTMTKERQMVALEASWEIEQLCQLLQKSYGDRPNVEHLAVRGVASRIYDLVCIVMSAIDDEADDAESIAKRLRH